VGELEIYYSNTRFINYTQKQLKNDYNFNEIEIIDKIKNKFWDLIIF
jgi:hypothetical protein